MTRVTTITLVALLLITPVQAQPVPHPKGQGQCSFDYVQRGAYCTPNNDKTRAAIPKVGQCPSGWAQSGSAVRGCADQELLVDGRVSNVTSTCEVCTRADTVREETS
jgi:hypothetical protein